MVFLQYLLYQYNSVLTYQNELNQSAKIAFDNMITKNIGGM